MIVQIKSTIPLKQPLTFRRRNYLPDRARKYALSFQSQPGDAGVDIAFITNIPPIAYQARLCCSLSKIDRPTRLLVRPGESPDSTMVAVKFELAGF